MTRQMTRQEQIEQAAVDYCNNNDDEMVYGEYDAFIAGVAWADAHPDSPTLNADEVIAWLEDQACLGWIEDVEVHIFVDKFKKDFGLC